MDSHYDLVMKAREAAAGDGRRLYFAYSTILDRAAFDEWRQQHAYEFFDLPEGKLAVARDVSLVYDFPSRWWGGRVAGLAETPGAAVHGRLFEISDKDWPIIQHKEGAITGMCVEWPVKVEVEGKTVEAMAFTTRPERRSAEGEVSSRFVEALVRGAKAAGLPHSYVQSIATSAK
jgi:gamma-glutamylcyclotransferase